ncbi:MAG: carboxypeptidase-like regulatory domain-containing protein [Tannerellaceae bacterium]|nr:carboxypeptidase-like regulatory domain-containing protein [Tannerellaceae bacterium]
MRLLTNCLFLCLLVIGNSAWGNPVPGDIKGRVIEANSNEPLDFVNVTLRKKGVENAIPIGTTTDLDGNFVLTNVPNDTYLLQVSFIGYQTYQQEITLAEGRSSVTLPPIFLSEDTQVLNEVQVVGMRSQMRFEIDKKSI